MATDVPLVGSQCVQMVHCIPHGALDAYSAFLASVVAMELKAMARGPVNTAMKQARVQSPQAAGLSAIATSIKDHLPSSTNTTSHSNITKCTYIYMPQGVWR